MVTPAAHREAAAYLQQTYEMSQRRACRVIDGDRASVRYQARRPDDGELRERLKALAQERRRLLARATSMLAPRPDAVPPPAGGGMAVARQCFSTRGIGPGQRAYPGVRFAHRPDGVHGRRARSAARRCGMGRPQPIFGSDNDVIAEGET